MRCWIFFHRDLNPDLPEVKEILRFQDEAAALGIELEACCVATACDAPERTAAVRPNR